MAGQICGGSAQDKKEEINITDKSILAKIDRWEKNEINPFCVGCRYLDDADTSMTRGCCFYILATGRSRERMGSPFGTGCTVKAPLAAGELPKLKKEEKQEKPEKHPGCRLKLEPCLNVISLRMNGMTIDEITTITGVSHKAVADITIGERYKWARQAWEEMYGKPVQGFRTYRKEKKC